VVDPPPITQRIVITPPMMLTQRLAPYFNSRDRKTIAIEISVTMAAINKNLRLASHHYVSTIASESKHKGKMSAKTSNVKNCNINKILQLREV
jgi:hypothetical protein